MAFLGSHHDCARLASNTRFQEVLPGLLLECLLQQVWVLGSCQQDPLKISRMQVVGPKPIEHAVVHAELLPESHQQM